MDRIVQSPNKHYSPLRYPGGKSSLSNFLTKLIKTNEIASCTYVEPYAGGAGAALTLLFLERVDSIIINDYDQAIFSFWKSILTETDSFIDRIRATNVSIDEWHRQQAIYKNRVSDELDLGFATFFLNRTNRSGIIGGRPIGGLNQTGKWLVDARFNKRELIDRIRRIASYKSRITVLNKDGIELLRDIHKVEKQFVYLDPPYYAKGSGLYLNHYMPSDHHKLADFLNQHNDFFWALTYDNLPEVRALYRLRRSHDFSLNYHTGLPKIGKEFLVLSDKVTMMSC